MEISTNKRVAVMILGLDLYVFWPMRNRKFMNFKFIREESVFFAIISLEAGSKRQGGI